VKNFALALYNAHSHPNNNLPPNAPGLLPGTAIPGAPFVTHCTGGGP
jgi:hypothetical protein